MSDRDTFQPPCSACSGSGRRRSFRGVVELCKFCNGTGKKDDMSEVQPIEAAADEIAQRVLYDGYGAPYPMKRIDTCRNESNVIAAALHEMNITEEQAMRLFAKNHGDFFTTITAPK